MADPNIYKFLIHTLEGVPSPAEWNRFRAEHKDIDLTRADFSNCALANYNLSRVNLAGARLFNADLSGADLSKSNLTHADLRRANFANAYLTGANLSAANLKGANLVDTSLDDAVLKGANLGGAHLVGASLLNADLENAYLMAANMRFAAIKGAKLAGADVEEADLSGVELTDEMKAALENFDMAIIREPGANGEKKRRRRIAVEEGYEELFREEDACKILKVSPGASPEEVTKAYRQRAKEYHPDRVAHLGEKIQYVANREFVRVQHAYKSLLSASSDPLMTIKVREGDRMVAKDARDLAVDDYIELLKWQPNNDTLHYNLGVKYLQMGLPELASKAYEKAIELNPSNEHARHNLKLAKLALALQE